MKSKIECWSQSQMATRTSLARHRSAQIGTDRHRSATPGWCCKRMSILSLRSRPLQEDSRSCMSILSWRAPSRYELGDSPTSLALIPVSQFFLSSFFSYPAMRCSMPGIALCPFRFLRRCLIVKVRKALEDIHV
ncbi:hypothetical protein BV25DRAFT_1548191 [Artomyces pyxidatus]|uniref:Uncharacterized protein n=1 Tax=Artomyces pyxidatus TaxID=48021 RepID=A0ACB8SJQ2_9AGAM|nr:hypothetical protein BV25DRAFT_1548191 [Artomyces pyxidatus]